MNVVTGSGGGGRWRPDEQLLRGWRGDGDDGVEGGGRWDQFTVISVIFVGPPLPLCPLSTSLVASDSPQSSPHLPGVVLVE